MFIQPVLLSLCAAIILSGCSSSSTTKKVDSHSNLLVSVATSSGLDKTHMQVYITSAAAQLLLLEQQEAKPCISGQLSIAHTYLSQASAEHTAGMDKDAFITLLQLDRQVRKIRCINQYIKGQLGCGYTNKKIILKRWYDEGDFNQCKNPVLAKSEPKLEPKPKETSEEKYMLITEALHDFDQDQIKPIYHHSLNKLIKLIKRYPNSTLVISGHTDTIGSSEYNSQLSKRRAQNVAKYFTKKGIKSAQIIIKNKGEENIREVEKSDAARVFNRYTSITLSLDTRGKSNI
ncbi:MAG: OmpA family protein [Colwellia sp.]|nr:OmpA family protein [Colwellia sp.]